MTLESAIDELIAHNDLVNWCNDFIANQQLIIANQQLELLAIALSN